MLKVRNLSVFRGDVQVLEDVGLTLEEGSVVVLELNKLLNLEVRGVG